MSHYPRDIWQNYFDDLDYGDGQLQWVEWSWEAQPCLDLAAGYGNWKHSVEGHLEMRLVPRKAIAVELLYEEVCDGACCSVCRYTCFGRCQRGVVVKGSSCRGSGPLQASLDRLLASHGTLGMNKVSD